MFVTVKKNFGATLPFFLMGPAQPHVVKKIKNMVNTFSLYSYVKNYLFLDDELHNK